MLRVRAGQELIPLARLAYFGYILFYRMSITIKPKKRGRPATGKNPLLGFRAPSELRAAIEAWRKKQRDLPSRSEAIRRLVERGLARR